MHRLLAALATMLLLSCLNAEERALQPCVAPYGDSDFLTITEYVVLDALPAMPPALRERGVTSVQEYLQAFGQEKPPIEISNDMANALILRIGTSRWIVFSAYVSYVRRSAISVIDEQPGALHFLPPTPAVPGGAGALAQPLSRGVTLIAASGRVFCGVRSQARTLALNGADIDAFAKIVLPPSAGSLVKIVASPEPHSQSPK